MVLSKEQSIALDKINRWLKSDDWWCFRLGGYAGTGKTFLLQHLINSYDERLTCCAPTGKAASVLRSKLDGMDVSTIHSVLYKPVAPYSEKLDKLLELLEKDPDNKELQEKVKIEAELFAKKKVSFLSKETTEIMPGQLVIIDEASMVTPRMIEDIKATGCRALFVGDPGQLPPVNSANWFSGSEVDYTLETVQRQALDSPIVRMSLEVREGGLRKSNYQYDDCKIISKADLTDEDWLATDQVITGRNATRHRLNRYFRNQLDFHGEMPVAGDKLICLKNESVDDTLFINGTQCVATSDTHFDENTKENYIDIDYEGNELEAVKFYDYHCRLHYSSGLVEAPWFNRQNYREFDYSYAITVHKSQGSEWDSVIIADDKMQYEKKKFRKRWLYTAITRAKNKLIWAQV